ncbi:ubiquinol-cytochrome c reductase iron-sulfur subunit [Rhodococcus rhodochrous]|uniref:Cytochrome bc1 complex Rieske iron-sulfur subunit n=1 Tax=Rhodococcus rhodochrous KG-21 TaxID=1441923 RepID=A0A0M8PH10_RHORH|nr:Rieske (2Fe-2S) protein [Rhodococcus rhodochrous]KOS54755.1 (2Fe-2S)-binding protein [Rhodococcus rhodochrous KG-21]
MSIDPTDRRPAPTGGQPRLCRRALFGGAGAVAAAAVLSACGTETEETGSTPAAPTTPPEPGPDAAVVAAAADIPVGSGVLFADRRLVVTQPVAGDYRAFVALCTHSGCNITGVEAEEIVCDCHGSRFRLDGTVSRGPARKPLKARPAGARGADVVVD